MATAREILLVIRVRNEALRELRSVTNQLNQVEGPLGNITRGAAAAASILTTVAVGVGTVGVNFLRMRESAEVGLGFVLRNAQLARDMVAELVNFSLRNPVPIEPLIKAARTMAAYGMEATKLVPTLRAIAEANAAMDGTPDTFNRIAYAIAQVQAKGRVQAEEVRQLANAGIPALAILAEKTGQTQADLLQAMKNGKLGIESVTQLIEGIAERYKGALEAAGNTLNGMITRVFNFGKAWASVAAEPAFIEIKARIKDLLTAMDTPEFMASARRVGEAVASIVPVISFVAVNFARGVLEIAGWMSRLQGWVMNHKSAIVAELALIGTAFYLMFGPAGVILGALGAAIVFLGAWEGDWMDFWSKMPDPVLTAVENVLTILQSFEQAMHDIMMALSPFFAIGAAVRGDFELAKDIWQGNVTTAFGESAQLVARRRGEIAQIREQREAANRWAVPRSALALPGTGGLDEKNIFDGLLADLEALDGGVKNSAKAANDAAEEHNKYLKLVEQSQDLALKATARVAEEMMAAAVEIQKAKERIQEAFRNELNQLVNKGTKFSDQAWKVWAGAAGLNTEFAGPTTYWSSDNPGVSSLTPWPGQQAVSVSLSSDLSLDGVQ